MSDEELLLFNDIYNQTQHFGRTQFVREIMKLQQENKELQERINKAIEYIEYNATSNYFDKEKNMFRREEDLLDILKGVE